MRRQVKRSMVAIGTAAVLVALLSPARSVVGQSSTTVSAPRTADGQPDLNGFWQALNTANWDLEEHGALPSPNPKLLGAYLAQPPGPSVVEGGTIPYKPEALAERKRFREGQLQTDPLNLDNTTEDTADSEAKCFQGGVPRSTYMPFPSQIVQTKDKIFIAYQFGGQSPRLIHVVNSDLAKARSELPILDIDSFMGQSVGRWEKETLVVDTRWFAKTVRLDRAGNFYTQGASVTEHYTPISPYHIRYEATIEDPSVFTRPWKISMTLYKLMEQQRMELLEFQCIPFAEEFMYGALYKQK
jgi:hypothetical protein